MKSPANAQSVSSALRTAAGRFAESKLEIRNSKFTNRIPSRASRRLTQRRSPAPAGAPLSPTAGAPGNSTAENGSERLLTLLPQVRFIARRIHRHLPGHVPVEDLYQAGVLGLLDALRKFDPQRRVRFESYMKFRIRGAILDELRSLDWSPRELRRQGRRLDEAHQALCARLGREPALEELAAAAHVSLRKLERLRGELRGLELSSLQETVLTTDDGAEKDRGSLIACHESIGPLAMFAQQESRERLTEAIAALPENERRVLTLYYYEELTMKEVGEVLSVGESRVSQIHSSALERIRSWVSRNSLPGAAAASGNAAAARGAGLPPPTAA